ncbi:MAG: S-methyl-5-thioribose-1-phosphate isomerase, partial [Thermoleophilaceae bacterium]|nr:S-methyl-5-thioribose-1-phosphate isomerase [Thermoleophilaceae bacterium]
MPPEQPVRPMRWREGTLELLDQTLLPAEERWIRCETHEDVAEAIERLAVRGAPSIGLATAYGWVVGLNAGADPAAIEKRLAATRPTAVNLRFALERMRSVGSESSAALALAEEMARERAEEDGRIAEAGAALFKPGDRALTHCNAGPLATAGAGTAGGVLAAAHAAGRLE